MPVSPPARRGLHGRRPTRLPRAARFLGRAEPEQLGERRAEPEQLREGCTVPWFVCDGRIELRLAVLIGSLCCLRICPCPGCAGGRRIAVRLAAAADGLARHTRARDVRDHSARRTAGAGPAAA